MSDAAPQRQEILTALERLLAWPEISRSPQLGKFLAYIVRRTLDGDEQGIKAYSIAVDVFGRAADFDPQADPIVRVQARRLRTLLDDYYQGPGGSEAMQIRLPVGRYVPEFVAVPVPGKARAGPVPPVSRARWPAWSFGASWFALALVALGIAMTAYGLNAWRPGAGAITGPVQRPSVTVVEFQDLADGAAPAPVVAGLAIELVTDLEQFGNLRVGYGGGGATNLALRNLPSSDYMLTGIVRPDGDMVQYSAILTDSGSGEVVWNDTIAVPAGEAALPSVLDRVSRSLSLMLGSPRGPLHRVARQYLASAPAAGVDSNAYLCRVLFDLYRETGGSREAARASACYGILPAAERDTAVVLAAMAILTTEQILPAPPGSDEAARSEQLRLAVADLERAIGLDPISGFVWEQQGRLHEAQRALSIARADYSSSVQLNPASVDALAAYARLLALGGNLAEAEAMARDAVGSPEAPAWYYAVPALVALRDGDLAAAIIAAERYAQADRELGPILAIMAAQRSGDTTVVNRYLPQVLDVPGFHARGVLPRLRERITDDALVEAIRSALIEAGVPRTALTRPF